MLQKIVKALSFLRLLDDDGRLSLTNIAVWITLFKLATAANSIAPTDIGAVIGALASYQAKRWIGKPSAQ